MSLIFLCSGAVFARVLFLLSRSKWRKAMEERKQSAVEKMVEWALENAVAFLAVGFCVVIFLKEAGERLLLAAL